MRNSLSLIVAALGRLNSPIKLLIGLGVALALAYLAPGAGPVRVLAMAAELCAIAGGALFGLTFWHDANPDWQAKTSLSQRSAGGGFRGHGGSCHFRNSFARD
jgi:hypothetical protein